MMEEKEHEATEEESFAALFEATGVKKDFLTPGQKVEARIAKITRDWIFLDLGGKSEGYLDRKELADEGGNLTVKEGDVITAYFLSSKANEKLFTSRIGAGDSARDHIEEIWRSGIPIEGTVEKEIKGGFEIKLVGGMRGFCPFSQMELRRSGNPQDYIGQKLAFQIAEFGERGRNIVLSRRPLLEEQKKKDEETLKEKLREGMIVPGTVVSLRDFGAFVDIGGIQGLLPISEIGWDRVSDIHQHLSVGQTVNVAITKLDWEKNRISLSLKQTLSDPWEDVGANFPEGTLQKGAVVRLTAFGAFVNLGPGIDGLIHISKLGKGKRITHPREVLKEGEVVDVRVDAIDREHKRISLSLPGAEGADRGAAEEQGASGEDYRSYVGRKAASFGSLGDLLQQGPKKNGEK